MTRKELYAMELHDKVFIEEDSFEVLRVPGGWIYNQWVPATRGEDEEDGTFRMTSCFVPYVTTDPK